MDGLWVACANSVAIGHEGSKNAEIGFGKYRKPKLNERIFERKK